LARTRFKTNLYASHLSSVAGTITTLETNTLTINTAVTIPANQVQLGSATAGSIAAATGHLFGVYYSAVFTGATTVTCSHGLGQAVVGWEIVGRTGGDTGIIYCSDISATATNVQFSSTASATVKLFMF